MIKYNHEIEFQRFLNTITYSMCQSEDDYKTLTSIGIDPNDWPVSSNNPAKKALLEFSTMLKSKPYEFVRVQIKSNYNDFIAFDLMHDFPADSKDLAIIYKYNLDAWSAWFKAQAVIKDKFNHELILSHTKSKADTDFFFNLRDNFESFFINKEKQIKENRALITIPDFPILSEAIGGFNPGRLTIIAAQSGFGKTRLAVNLSLSAMKIAPVFYFNMEMSKDDFNQLFLQAFTGLSSRAFIHGGYINHPEAIKKYKDHIDQYHHTSFTSGRSMSLEVLVAKATVHAKEHPFSFIIIDYDQKILSSSRGDEWMIVLKAIEQLEDVAKETNSHVIILAQGNDDGDAKSSKRAKQPASAFLSFLKDENNTFYIKAIKNRWGKQGIEIVVNVEQESGQIVESHIKDDVISHALSNASYKERRSHVKNNDYEKSKTPNQYKD